MGWSRRRQGMAFPTSQTGRREARGLTRRGGRGICAVTPLGGPMGWLAIVAVVIFIAAIAALNRYEFGRFD